VIDTLANSATNATASIAGIAGVIDNFANRITPAMSLFNNYDTEVNHLPAGQQWPVCTP